MCVCSGRESSAGEFTASNTPSMTLRMFSICSDPLRTSVHLPPSLLANFQMARKHIQAGVARPNLFSIYVLFFKYHVPNSIK